MEFTNGLREVTSVGLDSLGLSMTQYEVLMKRLDQLQAILDRFTEQESKKTEFIIETRFRLKTIETQLEDTVAVVKEQAAVQQTFHDEVHDSLEGLREKANAIGRQAEQFPHDMKLQWKSVTTFLSGGAIVVGAIWAFFQGLWWIYHNLVKTGN